VWITRVFKGVYVQKRGGLAPEKTSNYLAFKTWITVNIEKPTTSNTVTTDAKVPMNAILFSWNCVESDEAKIVDQNY
jgi:hypothetical protein